MSAVTRDTGLTAVPGGNGSPWPDRLEMTAPALPAGRPVRSRALPTGRWSIDMPERAWPPLPEGMRPTRDSDGDLLEPLDDDEIDAAQFDEFVGTLPERAPIQRAPVWPTETPAGRKGSGVDTPQGGFSFQLDAASAPADWSFEDTTPMRRDPSPSRLSYRLNRLWLTPGIRTFVRFGLPLLISAIAVGGWVSSAENRAKLEGWGTAMVDYMQNQPMFQVNSVEVDSASPEVAQGVEQLLDLSFPTSSWDLDLPELRARAESLDAVEGAWLQIRSGGVLEIRLTERVPAMVWRSNDGLFLVDDEGHRVARLATRAARGDLPLIAGVGAPAAVAEAQALWNAAAPIQPRMRGLVRIGERRWDVVLDRGQRIMLPSEGAVEALERVVAMTEGVQQQLLSRDVMSVDMRNSARPTLRLSESAMAELARNRNQATGAQSR